MAGRRIDDDGRARVTDRRVDQPEVEGDGVDAAETIDPGASRRRIECVVARPAVLDRIDRDRRDFLPKTDMVEPPDRLPVLVPRRQPGQSRVTNGPTSLPRLEQFTEQSIENFPRADRGLCKTCHQRWSISNFAYCFQSHVRGCGRGAVLALQRNVARAMNLRNCRAGTCIDACKVCGTRRATPKKVRAGAGMRRLARRSHACRRAPVVGAHGFATAAARRARQHRCDGLARRPGRNTGTCA